jgi:hypothetical protein
MLYRQPEKRTGVMGIMRLKKVYNPDNIVLIKWCF